MTKQIINLDDVNTCFEIAYTYINHYGGNKTETIRKFISTHNLPHPSNIYEYSYRLFKNSKLLEMIDFVRTENRKEQGNLRDYNIATLKNIAFNPQASNTERINAIKELNHMCGYSTLNINQQQDINITLEGFDI